MALWNHPHLQALSATGTLRAWTGGSSPQPMRQVSAEERCTVRALLEDQIADWTGFWKDKPDRATLRTLWRRARYDAHATHRA